MGLFDSLKRQAENLLKTEVGKATNYAVNSVSKVAVSTAKSSKVTISKLPLNVSEMKQMPEFTLNDPLKVATFAVAALDRYSANREDAKEMLNCLKGPEPLTNREIQFINDRFMDGKSYVTRSYFLGSSPENDYTPATPYTAEITEQFNSRENEGYIKLYIKSSGADSLRPITLRYKPSSNEWFLWEFDSILSGIRIPKSTDKWA